MDIWGDDTDVDGEKHSRSPVEGLSDTRSDLVMEQGYRECSHRVVDQQWFCRNRMTGCAVC